MSTKRTHIEFSHLAKSSYEQIVINTLDCSNTVVFRESIWREFAPSINPLRIWKSKGALTDDPIFHQNQQKLQPFIKDRFVSSQQYLEDDLDSIPTGEAKESYKFTVFTLTPEIKAFFRENGFEVQNFENTLFYGYEDPVFFMEGKFIAGVISHELLLETTL